MSLSTLPTYPFSRPKESQLYRNCSRWKSICRSIRCATNSDAADGNYYQLLGVSVDSDAKEIKEAYRKLQKKYHPDIAGHQGHKYTLKLNEAYKILISEDHRRDYDISIGQSRKQYAHGNTVTGFSSWKGAVRSQALFVDENACIGCRECVYHASNTFLMDEAAGSARVKLQFGDDDRQIQVSVDSCPVNCIHWVDKEDLAVLEFLIQPKQKQGYGVFGQGWDRPTNVFAAAKALTKQLQRQPEHFRAGPGVEEETPAQAEARASASMKIQMEKLSKIWNLVKRIIWFDRVE